MEPDTRTDEQEFRDDYFKLEFDCRWLSHNLDCTWGYSDTICCIDRQGRRCEGKCKYFESNRKRWAKVWRQGAIAFLVVVMSLIIWIVNK
jgi:predicted nucleic acid-binding Zn ribbon protein